MYCAAAQLRPYGRWPRNSNHSRHRPLDLTQLDSIPCTVLNFSTQFNVALSRPPCLSYMAHHYANLQGGARSESVLTPWSALTIVVQGYRIAAQRPHSQPMPVLQQTPPHRSRHQGRPLHCDGWNLSAPQKSRIRSGVHLRAEQPVVRTDWSWPATQSLRELLTVASAPPRTSQHAQASADKPRQGANVDPEPLPGSRADGSRQHVQRHTLLRDLC